MFPTEYLFHRGCTCTLGKVLQSVEVRCTVRKLVPISAMHVGWQALRHSGQGRGTSCFSVGEVSSRHSHRTVTATARDKEDIFHRFRENSKCENTLFGTYSKCMDVLQSIELSLHAVNFTSRSCFWINKRKKILDGLKSSLVSSTPDNFAQLKYWVLGKVWSVATFSMVLKCKTVVQNLTTRSLFEFLFWGENMMRKY